VPPGWHDDPTDPTSLRYWDGQKWTEQRAPRPVAAPDAVADPGRGNAVASLILGVAGVFTFWLFGVVPLVAFILGMQSRTRSKGARMPMQGMAIAGVILGVLGMLAALPIILKYIG
jgi:hypothetical protein